MNTSTLQIQGAEDWEKAPGVAVGSRDRVASFLSVWHDAVFGNARGITIGQHIQKVTRV